MSDEVLLRAEGLVPAGLDAPPALDLALASGLVVVAGPGRERLSVWLRTLAGLAPPAAGNLLLLGRPLSGAGAHRWQQLRRRVGYVSPAVLLLSIMSGLRNVMLPAQYHRLAPEREVERRARTLLGEIAYDADHDALPAHMSELQRRHLLIARALILEPRVLLLEQPLDGLDLPAAERLREYLVDKVRPRVQLLLVAANDALLARRADAVLFVSRQSVRLFDSWAALLADQAADVQRYLEMERRPCAALEPN
ncbi:MAG: ABC transporter ATP-binding protein [Thiohalomonadaceae bacterium]